MVLILKKKKRFLADLTNLRHGKKGRGEGGK